MIEANAIARIFGTRVSVVAVGVVETGETRTVETDFAWAGFTALAEHIDAPVDGAGIAVITIIGGETLDAVTVIANVTF